MIHIATYAESAGGSLHRELGRGEFGRMISGQVRGRFAPAEVRAVVDAAAGVGWSGDIGEYEVSFAGRRPFMSLVDVDHLTDSTSVSLEQRSTRLGKDGRRGSSPLPLGTTATGPVPSGQGGKQEPVRPVILMFPGVVARDVPGVSTAGMPLRRHSPANFSMSLHKSEDDYVFAVGKDAFGDRLYFVCDGVQGVAGVMRRMRDRWEETSEEGAAGGALNESAGKAHYRVYEWPEIVRMISGQVPDFFTQREVKAVVDALAGIRWTGHLEEYHRSGPSTGVFIPGEHSHDWVKGKSKTTRTTKFTKTEAEEYDDLSTEPGSYEVEQTVHATGVQPNIIELTPDRKQRVTGRLREFWNDDFWMVLYKSEDDYFFAVTEDSYYACDGIDGVVALLKELRERWEDTSEGRREVTTGDLIDESAREAPPYWKVSGERHLEHARGQSSDYFTVSETRSLVAAAARIADSIGDVKGSSHCIEFDSADPDYGTINMLDEGEPLREHGLDGERRRTWSPDTPATSVFFRVQRDSPANGDFRSMCIDIYKSVEDYLYVSVYRSPQWQADLNGEEFERVDPVRGPVREDSDFYICDGVFGALAVMRALEVGDNK